MRVRPRFINVLLGCLLLPGLAGAQQAAATAAPKQDPDILRFARRLEAWYPDSSFKVTTDQQEQTASGPYRIVQVDRSCSLKFLAGTTTMVIDEATGSAWVGPVANLPTDQMGPSLSGLRTVVADYLQEALARNLHWQVSVDWSVEGQRAGALIPFKLMVSTGYGRYPRLGAVTSDGRFVVLGPSVQWGEDPVAHRRELLHSSPLVMWDHPGSKPKVEIVEFSDFECPGCKAKWPVIKKLLDAEEGAVRHGMVNFPLTNMHPWAFRAASAGWCVAQQNKDQLLPLKEEFYSLQPEMEVAQVAPTANDFVTGHGLDEKAFAACFLKAPSLEAVHDQLALGCQLMVDATPTYFVNGWKVVAPEEDWLLAMVKRLVNGDEP